MSFSLLFPFFYTLEKPLAVLALQNSVTTIVGKTIGLGFIPSLNAIFVHGSTQYPRNHTETSQRGKQWDIFYLVLYGGFGIYAQYMGYLWTVNRNSSGSTALSNDNSGLAKTTTVQQQAKALGLFHVAISIHHTIWALFPKYGQLTLEHLFGIGNRIPYILEGIVGVMTGYHGYKLFTVASSIKDDDEKTVTSAQKEQSLIRHKILCDFSSLCSLIPIFGFWPINMFDLKVSKTYNQGVWLATSIIPLTFLLIDFVTYKDSPTNNQSSLTDDESETKKSN